VPESKKNKYPLVEKIADLLWWTMKPSSKKDASQAIASAAQVFKKKRMGPPTDRTAPYSDQSAKDIKKRAAETRRALNY
jgi:hypothetical protein